MSTGSCLSDQNGLDDKFNTWNSVEGIYANESPFKPFNERFTPRTYSSKRNTVLRRRICDSSNDKSTAVSFTHTEEQVCWPKSYAIDGNFIFLVSKYSLMQTEFDIKMCIDQKTMMIVTCKMVLTWMAHRMPCHSHWSQFHQNQNC